MLTRFLRSRPTPKGSIARRTQLFVESLESRLCPTPLDQLNLTAQILPGHQVLLSGTVTGPVPAGVVVTFNGAATGSAISQSNGNFSLITSQATTGLVVASGIDSLNRPAIPTTALIVDTPPVLLLSVIGETPTSVTLFGNVSDIDQAAQTVTISGVAQGTAVTDANGNFLLTTNASTTGVINASTTDLWGQTSSVAGVNLTSLPTAITPHITLNEKVLAGHEVQLTGTVTDQNPGSVVVTFSGAVTGSTVASPNGNFIFTTEAANLGTVYAGGTDQQQQTTNIASTTVAVAPPVLTLTIVSSTANTVTLSGNVTDLDGAGQTVTISGAASGSVVSDANGNFLLTTTSSGSGVIQAVSTDLWGQSSNTAQVSVNNSAASPLQLSVSAQVLSGHEVLLSGSLIGSAVAGVIVTFSGAVSGSTTTDANGNYSFETSSGSLGTVYAVATNALQQTSNTAEATVTVSPPKLTFAITGTSATAVTLTGKLTGVDAGNQTITIGGAAGGTVVTDAQGNFTVSENIATTGFLTVSDTDLWGQTSNSAEVDMPTYPPAITRFSAICQFENDYVFRGQVTGENVAGLTVNFGGVTGLQGQSTTVRADGSFYFLRTLPANTSGAATAQVTDQYGRLSNMMESSVGD